MIKEIIGKVYKIEFEGTSNVLFVQALDINDAYSQVEEIEKCGDIVTKLYSLDKNGFTREFLRKNKSL